MYESVHETRSQTNCISLHVTVTPTQVKLWHGQESLNQTDKAMDLILNFGQIQILTSFQSMGIKIYCTLKEANSNDVILLEQMSINAVTIITEEWT